MDKFAKIYVAGHRGLVGSALIRQLIAQGYKNIVTRTHTELDLTNQIAVADFFTKEKPDYVFLAAAKVGGIHANNTYPAEFIHDNLTIQTNVIHQSYLNNVKRLLFLGSSCIYPKECPQPIKEEYLLTGPLEPTNRPYALAKIAGIEMCWSYNRQYGTKFLAAMPTNLYGINDNYHPENSHVIPALIRRFHEAKCASSPHVMVWGTGTPKREFLFSDDLANGCLHLLNLSEEVYNTLTASTRNDGAPPLVNIGAGKDITIKELADLVSKVVGYKGDIYFDTTKPDGTTRKLMDISLVKKLGWSANTDFEDGLKQAYQQYVKGIG
ncbi:MAG: GDP-L-fucose synthase family protein [Methylophilus sp.]